jgi:NTE family protein
MVQYDEEYRSSGGGMVEMKAHEPLQARAGQRTPPDPAALDGHRREQATVPRGPRRPRWRAYTAFVLSGGGARGALQVGALRALLEAGERPDVVIGTSIGAWNGAWLARTPTLEGIEALAAAWRSLHPTGVLLGTDPPANAPTQAVRSMRLLAVARRLTSGYPSVYPNTGLQNLVNTYLKDVQFEDMAVPLRIIATDLTRGQRMVFESGPVGPAVLASSAIPAVFPPVRIGDAVYVDGGALDNASLETALALGARRIFVLDVGYDESSAGAVLWSAEQPVRSGRAPTAAAHAVAAVLERTVQVVSRYQLMRALERVPRGIEVHVIQPSTGEGGGALDFAKAPAWIERGYAEARKHLLAHLPEAAAVHR